MISCDYFVFIITLSSATLCYSFRNSYTAAVVDYLHIYEDNPEDLLKKNVDQYLQFMRNASSQNADIIVFPEYGIVGLDAMYIAEEKNSSELTKYGTYVPDPTQNIAPCDYLKCEMCKEHLVNLSCAARANAIYTVVNLPEMEFNNDTGETDFHNTNVVFDRSGAVIAKFRKINLSQEPFLKAGRKIVTFVTDFNVTFGIFTCFDLLFRYPAMEVLSNPEVTDVIFPTAWYSETPFLQGLSIQHGYAKSKGVNMLASALQEPYYSDGGSAIYLSDGSIAEAFITNKRESRMLVNDVPIIQKRAIGACENLNKGIKKPLQKGEYTDIDNFPLNRDGTKGYIYEPLGKQGKTQTRICTDNEDFCCFFNITVDSSSVTTADYGHRIAIYKGLSPFGSNVLGAIRTCALIACLNETEESCGFRTNTSQKSTKFESIEIQTIVDITNDTHNQPSTLKADLTPISDYVYCETKISDSKVKIKMALTSPEDSLLTFGIYGRMYSMDAMEEDTKSSPLPPVVKADSNAGILVAVVCVSAVLLLGTAFILWKFFTKIE